MLTLLILTAALGAATIGGVFFAFSTFVMRALAQLPPAQGVAAMQRINVVVLNPMFLGTFVGTAVLQGLAALLAMFGWDRRRARRCCWPAPVLYVVGLLRRDDRLQRARATSGCGHCRRSRRLRTQYWPIYLREWTWWNHVRTAAALAAAACGLAALVGDESDARTHANAVSIGGLSPTSAGAT